MKFKSSTETQEFVNAVLASLTIVSKNLTHDHVISIVVTDGLSSLVRNDDSRGLFKLWYTAGTKLLAWQLSDKLIGSGVSLDYLIRIVGNKTDSMQRIYGVTV